MCVSGKAVLRCKKWGVGGWGCKLFQRVPGLRVGTGTEKEEQQIPKPSHMVPAAVRKGKTVIDQLIALYLFKH